MTPPPTPPLRLTLADPSPADLDMLAGWMSRQLSLSLFYSGGRQSVTADGLRQSIDAGREQYVMVLTRATGRAVGFVSYRPAGGQGNYDVGIGIGDPAEWGAGFGAEAFALLLDLLFHRMGAHRVQITVAAYNKKSLALIGRGGFTVEGVLREAHFLDGRWHDSVVASILAPEYYAADIYQPIPDLVPEGEKASARAFLARLIREQGGIGAPVPDDDAAPVGSDEPALP
ncbi:hypothetical protein BFL35_14030 [Clavibacter michiganensis]|nr:hypothetical protein BFL35_14030 [Clavibacter michiganensis]